MKNTSLVINGILALAVVILFVLHFTSPKSNNPAEVQDSTEQSMQPQSGGLKLAYVFIDSLLANYKLAQELTEELIKSKENLENELASKGQKLEKKIADFQYQIQKGLITSWDAQEKEKKLTEEQQVFMNLQNDMQGRLLRDEQEMNKEVYDAVMDFVAAYNESRNYNLIISQSSGGVLLYAEASMNITKEVLDGLNEAFMADK